MIFICLYIGRMKNLYQAHEKFVSHEKFLVAYKFFLVAYKFFLAPDERVWCE